VELFLNLAGALVAVAMVCLWLRWMPRASNRGVDLRTQLIALGLLVLILFPVISVTDDLLAAENPAETDSFQRRDHEGSGPYATISSGAGSVEAALAAPPSVTSRYIAALPAPVSLPAAPALTSIANRPPPIA
jgi:hypothetical protein